MNGCLRLAKRHLLQRVEEGLQKNVVVSPLSFNAVLNMVAAGSTGRTSEQMLGFLGAKNIADVNSKSSHMMEIASTLERGVSSENSDHDNQKLRNPHEKAPIMSFLNVAWVDKRYPLTPSYRELLEGTYKAEARNVDFEKGNEVVDEVNAWAATAARGLVPDIIRRGSINPPMMLILTNALYFKGSWKNKFDPKLTEDRDFYLADGNKVKVRFMSSYERYLYGSFNDFKVLKMPYQRGKENREFSMYIFLPDERDGLKNLLQKANSDPELFEKISSELSLESLDAFWVPKFKFSYSFEASNTMKHMGLTLPFSEDCGELTEMVRTPDVLRPPYISQVLQQACIDVAEEGTKAAAVTFVGNLGCALHIPVGKYKCFVADHPFMFMIREETSGLVFFTGVIRNPTR